jgi:plasmid stabilization system protein ParE
MSYHLVLQRLAVEDLDEAYLYAAEQAPDTAARWLERFHAALKTLEARPTRCPLARENRKTSIELREFLFGKRRNVFRVIFTIDGEAVRVLRIRRAQRRFLSKQEIEEAQRSIDE